MKRLVAQNREMRLVDGDLELRPWRSEDLAAVTEAARDPYIREIEHLDDPRAWLEQAAERSGLAILVDGAVAGGIQVASWHPRKGNLGYFVLERCRGCGIASRAASLLVRRALGDAYLYAAVRGDI